MEEAVPGWPPLRVRARRGRTLADRVGPGMRLLLCGLNPSLYAAVLGNVGTLVAFRVGQADAQILAREFAQEFSAQDLVGLPNGSIYLKLMVDGVMSRPFSGDTIKL